MPLDPQIEEALVQALTRHGFRATRQRVEIFAAIQDNHAHPTADDICSLVRQTLPGISLATVYNCLDSLVTCGLIRRVCTDRDAARYEPAQDSHAHFFCRDTRQVFDIALSEAKIRALLALLPPGFEADSLELRFEGRAPSQTSRDTPQRPIKKAS